MMARSTGFIAFAILIVAATLIGPSSQAESECKTKRAAALKQVQDQEKSGQGSALAILVPNCNEDGTYAQMQCHHGSTFCQCWDKDGSPLTSPKKNLKKCACMVDRAKALKSLPPSVTEPQEMTSCELDGSYTAKQCSRSACWCVNPDTGAKLTSENKDKNAIKC